MRLVTCDQYSAEYWAARRGVPTASEFGRVITPKSGALSAQAHGYACQLVADTFDPQYGTHEDYVSAAMKNGTIMEPEARRFYEFERSADVARVGFCLTDDGRFGCSPDGLVGDDGALELKSPTPRVHVEYLVAGVLPPDYRPQVHGHLIVTGRPWCDFMSYCRGFPPLLVRVEPDEFTDSLRRCLDEFADIYAGVLAKVVAMRGDDESPRLKMRETPDPIFMA